MSPIYTQAFEGTACTESSGSLTLMFTIAFAISFVGMMMITLRSAIYPCKKVYKSSSFDDEEDEWEDYQAYLRYMASFVHMWGGSEDEIATKRTTYETASESASHDRSNNIPQLGYSSTISSDEITHDEEAQAPIHSPSLHQSRKFEDSFEAEEESSAINEEDEERMPLSPPTSEFAAHQSSLYTPDARITPGDDSDDERSPLAPQTPKIPSSAVRSRRFMTPDFLTPGTFRRWRQHGDDDVAKSDELPETPSISSPTGEQGRVNYFASIISPRNTGGRSMKDE